MRALLVATLAAPAALFTAGCDLEEFAGTAKFKEDFRFSYAQKPGGRLAVEGFNGSITVTGWDQDQVEITGVKSASTKELLDALKIDAVQGDNVVRVRAVRPSGRRGNMGASFTIRAPRKTEIERAESSNGSVRIEDIEGRSLLRTSNGKIGIARVQGDVEAATSNGSIDLEEFSGGASLKTSNGKVTAAGIRGQFDAVTSNGSIVARIAETSGSLPVRLRTSNGRVELTLEQTPKTDVEVTSSNGPVTVRAPKSLAARLKAETSNGSIDSAFDVMVQGGLKSKTRLEGSINGGGPRLAVETSNASIHLEQM